jgi:hypothetical protein
MELNQREPTCPPNLLRMLKSLKKLALRRPPVRRRSRMSGQMLEAAARLT